MIDALLARASTRFVFVVGKGGVGKTTTAGALALALADKSAATHLISTDPAHSIGDLFQHDLTDGEPAASLCNARLWLEEFAAREYADALFKELRQPLIALIERGTYLDETDAASFLDLSIPGIDEVMSALRLVDLHESMIERVVVDTAPTGHTIRLFEAAGVIESWVAAGRAMAVKAGVVAAHLVGRRVRLPAEPLLDDLERRARYFRDEVLCNASAIVVTRPGSIVAAETRRLRDDLLARGLVTAAVIIVTDADREDCAEAEWLRVEHSANPFGCSGLRDWGSHIKFRSPALGPAAAPGPAPAPVRGPAENWVRSLDEKLILVAGKGGVGKSTCAAAIAAALCDSRRICLVSTDPAGSLSELLAAPVSASAREVEANFFALQIDAATEFQRMREQYRSSVGQVFESIGLESTAQLDRQVVESLWDFAPPGIDEIISLLDMLDYKGAFDTLIVDSAPTGHFLRLIELPEIAVNWVHALLRLLVKYGAVGSLDALARDLLGFSKRLRKLKLDLSTQGTSAVFVVTLDEPMVRAETARLSSALARAGVPVAATILNRVGSRFDARTGRSETEAVQRTPQAVAGGLTGGDDHRWIRAPDLRGEILGSAALRSFLAQWSINVE